MILDSKLNFQSHISGKQQSKPREVPEPFPIYPNIYHGVFWTKYINFMCERTCIMMTSFITTLDFAKKLESIQYSELLAVTGATNTDRLCEEVGWEILYYRKWYRRLCHFYKLRNYQRLYNLYSEVPQERILRNRFTKVLKQSFQVRGEHLTLFDFQEKQTLVKRCFVF